MNERSKRTGEESCDGPLSDRQLLRRFRDQDDHDAFAELVSRYCGLVLGVCRRTLRDEHSAEDAFQATFLVLARRGAQIRNRSSLAGWLHTVAYRTALRAGARRHRRCEEALHDDMTTTDDVLAQVTTRYEQQLLDEELHRLPAKYREPLVLRYLLGKSNGQVARELGLTVGVVEGRLKRGKDRLRLKLAKRGIGLTVCLAAIGVSRAALKAATADRLVAATVQAAAAFRTGTAAAGSHSQNVSQNAIRLAQQELAMSTSTITAAGAAAALAFVGLTLAFAGYAGHQAAQAESPELVAAVAADSPAASSSQGGSSPVGLAPAKEGPAEPDASEAEKREVMLWLKYGSFDKKSRSPAEKRILDALEQPTVMEFIDTPLADVVDTLKDYHAIEIQFDQKALDDVGIPSDTPITRALRGISLRSALRLMLRDLDLDFIVVDEVLLITTQEVADWTMETHVYGLHGDLAEFDAMLLADVIEKTIRPDTWRAGAAPEESNGSDETSSAPSAEAPRAAQRAAVEALPGCLVITQSQRAHEEIADLLQQLDLYASCARMLEEGSAHSPRAATFTPLR
jgi:RNA polymerase sigma factor (sigma-70 family)